MVSQGVRHEIRPGRSRDDLVEIYRDLAPRYDWLTLLPELLFLRRHRRRLLKKARGRTLELAVGTGADLVHYPARARLFAGDLSPEMLSRARGRARRKELAVRFLRLDAVRLPFPAACFDTVVDTLSLCTYPDPLAVLGEMRRVCRPDGRILLLEHTVSSWGWIARRQRRAAPKHLEKHGCRLDLDLDSLLDASDLRLLDHQQHLFSTLHRVTASP